MEKKKIKVDLFYGEGVENALPHLKNGKKLKKERFYVNGPH